MKKSRLFMATGALVLAVSAIFATKANKKFALPFSTGYSSKLSASEFAVKTTTGTGWLTATNNGNAAIVTITTSSGHNFIRTQLVTAPLGSTLLYY
jgi:hypothetical protein